MAFNENENVYVRFNMDVANGRVFVCLSVLTCVCMSVGMIFFSLCLAIFVYRY